MRSPKQRSRSKQNRPRTLGNIINRVFDSSGPEGKVRGTPQQIIEKYQVLARDAQLSNDRVAAENFQQHAEHYTRLLAQATREMQAEADARRIAHEESQNRNRHQQDDRGPRPQTQPQNGQPQNAQPQNAQPNLQPTAPHVQPQPQVQRRDDAVVQDPVQPDMADSGAGAFALVEHDAPDTAHLVETPEARDAAPDMTGTAPVRDARPPRNRPHRPVAAPKADTAPAAAPAAAPVDAAPAADAKPRRNQRRPRKPADDSPRAAE